MSQEFHSVAMERLRENPSRLMAGGGGVRIQLWKQKSYCTHTHSSGYDTYVLANERTKLIHVKCSRSTRKKEKRKLLQMRKLNDEKNSLAKNICFFDFSFHQIVFESNSTNYVVLLLLPSAAFYIGYKFFTIFHIRVDKHPMAYVERIDA